MARVLIIEPSALLAETYAAALFRAGHETRTAHTAQSAVDVADELAPQVVVLEVQMPGHNGVEFLYEFRSYAEWQSVPVVINTYTSAAAFEAVRAALEVLGVAAVLYKPQATLQKLAAAVREATFSREERKGRATKGKSGAP